MRVPRSRRFSGLLLAGGLTLGLLLSGPGAQSATAGAHRTAAARGTATSITPGTTQLDILLLGDSYSAGNGATDESGQAQTYGPADCYRSRVNWAEQYAAGLRAQGYTVNLANHACSGGKAGDFLTPRPMDTASDSTPTPAGVTTLEQADAYLDVLDPCNTHDFPDEEFWTYAATAVDSSKIDYDCTRTLRAQADFVTPETDLVLFTMGGNDAGFTNIVTQCFILKMGSSCQAAIDGARAKLPDIKQLLLDGIAGLRAAGLRPDAKIVQLGYPYLQTDNGYVAVGVPPYAAGDAVRSLIDDGTAALATVATDANVGHPGQMTFVPGIKEAFAGHEPDATTPAGNTARWVNQVGDGTNTSLWYHPNRLGQQAYAGVVLAGGDYGATPPAEPVRTTFHATAVRRTVAAGQPVRFRTSVCRSDGSRPTGNVLVRLPGTRIHDRERLDATGRTVLTLTGLEPGRHRVRAVYVVRRERLVVTETVLVRR